MSGFHHIGAVDAAAMIADGKADVVDIRDPVSFHDGHIPGATLLDNGNVRQFIAAADRTRPLIVCCYHGNSSQGAADFFVDQGFTEVYSLDGGIDAWRFNHPLER